VTKRYISVIHMEILTVARDSLCSSKPSVGREGGREGGKKTGISLAP
jgi:hypothetical protein